MSNNANAVATKNKPYTTKIIEEVEQSAVAVTGGKIPIDEIKAGLWLFMTNAPTAIKEKINSPTDYKQVVRQILYGLSMGLVADGRLGAIVIYNGKIVFTPMYHGLVKLARASGLVSELDADCIYEGDFIDSGYTQERGKYLDHKHGENYADRDYIVGAYAKLVMQTTKSDKQTFIVRMPKSEVLKRQQDFKKVWEAWPIEMYKKAMLIRVIKEAGLANSRNYALQTAQQILELDNSTPTPIPTKNALSEAVARDDNLGQQNLLTDQGQTDAPEAAPANAAGTGNQEGSDNLLDQTPKRSAL